MELRFKTQCDANRTLCSLEVRGEIDVSNADELRAELDKLITAEKTGDIEVDMEHVPYIDSSGIGVLMGAATRAKAAGHTLRVVNPQANIVRVFNMVGATEVLDITVAP